MAREFYTPKTKAAILTAVKDARAAKKSWAQAHTAAKAAGYKGGLPAIIKLTRLAGGTGLRRARRGPGRPPKNAARRGRPVTKTADLGSIDAALERIVEQRVREALDRAIAVLKSF